MNIEHELQALKQTVAELEAELSHYKCDNHAKDDFVNNGEQHLIILTIDLNFSHLDIGIKKIIGFSSDELIGKSISTLLTEKSFEDLKNRLKIELAVLEDEGVHDHDNLSRLILEGVTKTGTIIWYEIKFKYVLDSLGKPSNIFMHTKDITSQKKIEDMFSKRYEEEELQYKTLVDSLTKIVPISIFIYNFKTKKIWNKKRKIYKYLGYSLAEWTELSKEHSFLDLIDPNDKKKLKEIFSKVENKEKDIESGEFRIKDKVGNWHTFYCRITSFKKDKDGNVEEVIGFDYDITYTKNLEKDLRK